MTEVGVGLALFEPFEPFEGPDLGEVPLDGSVFPEAPFDGAVFSEVPLRHSCSIDRMLVGSDDWTRLLIWE